MKKSVSLRDIYVARFTEEGVPGDSFIRINSVDGTFTHPVISPDGTHVAYWGRSQGRLDVWVADLQTHSAEPITQGTGMSCHPAWSPDSRQLAYAHNPDFSDHAPSMSLYDADRFASREIRIMNLDTGKHKRLTTHRSDNERPAWSPDGRRMAYVTGDGEKKNIRVMDMLSGEEACVTDEDGIFYRPAWHPSGNHLAFNNKGPGSHYLWMIDADGRSLRQVTPSAPAGVTVHDHGAFWSADGRTILFHSDRSGKWGLWLIDVDESDMHPLTVPGIESISHGTWDACETWLCFDAGRDE